MRLHAKAGSNNGETRSRRAMLSRKSGGASWVCVRVRWSGGERGDYDTK